MLVSWRVFVSLISSSQPEASGNSLRPSVVWHLVVGAVAQGPSWTLQWAARVSAVFFQITISFEGHFFLVVNRCISTSCIFFGGGLLFGGAFCSFNTDFGGFSLVMFVFGHTSLVETSWCPPPPMQASVRFSPLQTTYPTPPVMISWGFFPILKMDFDAS